MASVDKGASVRAFPEQRAGGSSPAYDIGQIAITNGIFDPLEPNITRPGMQGGLNGAPTLDHSHPDRASTLVSPGLIGGGIPASITYYKMQGWYAAGSTYETWTSANAPNSTPPSGHTLSDIKVVGMVRH
jgi:hypothetical protein